MKKITVILGGIALAAVVFGVGFAAVSASNPIHPAEFQPYTIQFKTTQFLPPERLNPMVVRYTQPGVVSGTSAAHVLVQLWEVPSAAEREDLAGRGIELLHYIPDRAWIAAVSRDAYLTPSAFPELRWAGMFGPELKLTDRVQAREFEPYALDDQDRVHLAVMFCADVPFDAAKETAEAYGGEVINGADAINMLSVALPVEMIDSLAGDDAVLWVDQVSPGLTPVNDSNRADVGVETVWAAPYGLNGTGIKAFVFDAGIPSSTHPDLAGRMVYGQTSSVQAHATHVSGTIGGNGTVNATYKGMAPGVTYYAMSFDGSFPFFYNNPGDIQADYNTALNTGLVDLSNNSIGSNVAWNGNPCSWEGDYESSAALIDSIVRGSLGPRIPIFWAAGNERGGMCGSQYRLSAPPAPNKNAIVIGAINSNDDSMTDFSSWGPTDDGRMRPDVTAPGCQVNADGGVTSTVPPSSYTSMCGTSMASPTACGVGALLLQAWMQTFPAKADPLPASIKAILAQSALDLGNPGPDYQFGYGKIQAAPAVDLIINKTIVEGSIEQGGVLKYPVEITTQAELKVTLAWDDAPGTPNSLPNLVNNLDMAVLGPDGTTVYNAWTLNPANPAEAASTGTNAIDNIEQVLIPAPAPGYYLVQVIGTVIPQGPQDFGLTGTGVGLLSCDTDADGHDATYCGGDDCNDESDAVFPGHEEICDDGLDNDCNGLVDADDPACQGDDDDDDDDASGDDDDDSCGCGL